LSIKKIKRGIDLAQKPKLPPILSILRNLLKLALNLVFQIKKKKNKEKKNIEYTVRP
jgi:hypothetical protein